MAVGKLASRRRPRRSPAISPSFLLGLVQVGEHRLGVHHEGAAGVGETHRSHATLDERGARLALEGGDLLADRRLRERERRGRGGERAAGGDLPQHPEPAGIKHKWSLSEHQSRNLT